MWKYAGNYYIAIKQNLRASTLAIDDGIWSWVKCHEGLILLVHGQFGLGSGLTGFNVPHAVYRGDR
jgi:hypothetical protein